MSSRQNAPIWVVPPIGLRRKGNLNAPVTGVDLRQKELI